jgi:hypothetical protein
MDEVITSAIGSFIGVWAFVTCLWIKDRIQEIQSYRKDKLEFNLRNEAKFRNDL